MKQLRKILRRIWCALRRHPGEAYYGLVPVPGGQVVQVKCDLCGATSIGDRLIDIKISERI